MKGGVPNKTRRRKEKEKKNDYKYKEALLHHTHIITVTLQQFYFFAIF